jgi:hypothetical protein
MDVGEYELFKYKGVKKEKKYGICRCVKDE